MGSRKRATVTLDMPSRLEVLDKAGELVDQLAEAAGFEEDPRLDIRTGCGSRCRRGSDPPPAPRSAAHPGGGTGGPFAERARPRGGVHGARDRDRHRDGRGALSRTVVEEPNCRRRPSQGLPEGGPARRGVRTRAGRTRRAADRRYTSGMALLHVEASRTPASLPAPPPDRWQPRSGAAGRTLRTRHRGVPSPRLPVAKLCRQLQHSTRGLKNGRGSLISST